MRADKTKIEWTHLPGYVGASWNPFRARYFDKGQEKIGWLCTRFSPGCEKCYASAVNVRLGTGLPYDKEQQDKVSEVFIRGLDRPAQTKKPTAWFVNSMTDLFHPRYSDEMIEQVFRAMLNTPRHVYQILTKVPARAVKFFTWANRYDMNLIDYVENDRNIWLGTTIENQDWAHRLETLAKITPRPWVSYEPAIGPLDLTGLPKPTWLVVGGESGRNARRMDLSWLQETIAWGKANDVPVFVKQFGAALAKELDLKHPKGGDWSEWPEEFKVRQWPDWVKHE